MWDINYNPQVKSINKSMKNHKILILISSFLLLLVIFFISCTKDKLKITPPVTPPVDSSYSFFEQFDNVSGLVSKGWVFKNNSDPAGPNGWRQGRYESGLKFGIDTVGFNAYSSTTYPTDYISVDASAVSLSGGLSAWLISPPLPIKNGDVITFVTRAMNDAGFFNASADRMQLLANFTDESADCGNTPVSVGNFTTVLLDINPTLSANFMGGYPESWTSFSITISGLAAPVDKGRFAFRYVADVGGIDGGASSLIGIDDLRFTHN